MKDLVCKILYILFFRQRAARDHGLAVVLLQVLLENLDIQHSRFVQEESFLLQHNVRRYKQNFQVRLNDIYGNLQTNKKKSPLSQIFVLNLGNIQC